MQTREQGQLKKKKQNVWQTLSKIDIQDYVEEKNGLRYLGWSYAWKLTVEKYPDATYHFKTWDGMDCLYYKDETASVACEMTIDGITREMWLAITDNRNNSIKNPASSDIANTKQRCLVKCLAMHGLGLHLWFKDGLPLPTDDEALEYKMQAESIIREFESASQVAALEAVAESHQPFLNDVKQNIPKLHKALGQSYAKISKQLLEGSIENGRQQKETNNDQTVSS